MDKKKINQRWVQQAIAQYRHNMMGYYPSTQKAITPINQQLSLSTSVAKATTYLAQKGLKKRGCCH